MLLADALLDVLSVIDGEAFLLAVVGNSDELILRPNLEPCCFCECLRRNCNCVGQSMASLVPHYFLDGLCLLPCRDICAFLHKTLYKVVIH